MVGKKFFKFILKIAKLQIYPKKKKKFMRGPDKKNIESGIFKI